MTKSKLKTYKPISDASINSDELRKTQAYTIYEYLEDSRFNCMCAIIVHQR